MHVSIIVLMEYENVHQFFPLFNLYYIMVGLHDGVLISP